MAAFGIKTPPQHGPWSDFLDIWRAADEMEIFESAWSMDHFYPLTPPLGGKGPRRTLPAAARWADHWDKTGAQSPEVWKTTSDILDRCCADIGRDPAEIRRSVHLMWSQEADPAAMAASAADFGAAGVDLVIFSMRAPYDVARLEPLVQALEATT